MLHLRDYQQHAVDMTLDLWNQGLRAVLYVCPTGGGKTHVFAELARLNKGRTLILADRKRLVDQAADRCRAAGLTVGFEQAARRVGSQPPDAVCATIQSIGRAARLGSFAPDAFSLIVVDEADLGIAPTYRDVLDYFAEARVFGCTATPDRADGQSLGEIFEDVCATVDMGDLIRAGHLSSMRRHLVRIESVCLEKIPAKDGDFSDAAMEKILTQERALHEVVRPAQELAGERPSLAFATSVRHAEDLAAMFNRYRFGCARAIHGGMSDAERAEIVAAFERREFQFLCNCALLLRGVDLPFVSCVVMARPTLSRALYAQSIGRGTRVAPGKTDLLVLDYTDNSSTHDLCSPIDVLAPSALEEVKERAREILDEEQGADPLEVLDRAEAQLEADPALRERVRAKVAYLMQEAPTISKGIDWDAQPLGQISDGQLAARLGVSSSSVTSARCLRGIDANRPWKRIDWDTQPLGVVNDYELAKRIGIHQSTVFKARTSRGIEPSHKRKEIDWDAVPLGQVADIDLAKRLGVPRSTVSGARLRRGIASPNPAPDWKGINWASQPLGRVPDVELARQLGVTPSAVASARRRQGISAPMNRNYKGIDWDAQPLGQMSDCELAKLLGVGQGSVWTQRTKRGISPYRSDRE